MSRSTATTRRSCTTRWLRRSDAPSRTARPGPGNGPHRPLAAVMHVNTNTVLRAVRILRDEGLLELRSGHGIRVSGTPERGTLLAQAHALLRYARRNRYRRQGR